MNRKFRILYGILSVMSLAVMTIGTTYAYLAATTQGGSHDVQTESTIYSISMSLRPLYTDFSIIPMNDSDALKAVKNGCRDKYDRGACSAYTIDVYDWNEKLSFISGYMDVTTNNMQNLSYMMLRVSDEVTSEDGCTKVMVDGNEENYCIVREASSVGEGVGLSLGDSHDVTGITSTRFILIFWLSNLQFGQNDVDIGSFDAIITMQAGNGGQVKGSISNAIIVDDMVGGGE